MKHLSWEVKILGGALIFAAAGFALGLGLASAALLIGTMYLIGKMSGIA